MSGDRKLYALTYTRTTAATVYVYADSDQAAQDDGGALTEYGDELSWQPVDEAMCIDRDVVESLPDGARAWSGGEDGDWTTEQAS